MNQQAPQAFPPDPVETQAQTEANDASMSFGQLYQASLLGTTDLPAALGAPIKQKLWAIQQEVEMTARSLRASLGAPQPINVADASRQVFTGTAYPEAGNPQNSINARNTLAAAQQRITRMETADQVELQQAIDNVFKNSAQTGIPQGTSEARLSELRADMTAILDGAGRSPQARQVAAAQLVRDAVSRADDAMLGTLLGDGMRLTRQRLGLDDAALARAVFVARKERAQASITAETNINPNAWLHSPIAPKHAAFLDAQLDPQRHVGGVALRGAIRLRGEAKYVQRRTPR